MGVASDAKTYFESIEECAMINGIKGSTEVERQENSGLSLVHGIETIKREEKSCLSRVIGSVRWLVWVEIMESRDIW